MPEMNEEVISRNFIENEIDKDLQEGVYDKVVTRFPPEPNGYLHIGHAKSILLNQGLAKEYGGTFNLRFDDTNPQKEKEEFVDSISKDVEWICGEKPPVYFASNYFDDMYECALKLIRKGKAYVCDLSAEEIRICCLYLAQVPVIHMGHFLHIQSRSTIQARTKNILLKMGAPQGLSLKNVLFSLAEQLKSSN